jgi:hypothetical protein
MCIAYLHAQCGVSHTHILTLIKLYGLYYTIRRLKDLLILLLKLVKEIIDSRGYSLRLY